MSFNTDRASIEQFFIDNLADIDLRFEGQDYRNQEPPFVGVMIEPLSRANATIDNLSQETDGFIRVRIFTQRSEGIKSLLDLCDQVTALIDNQVIGDVVTYAADVPKELNTEDAYTAKEISVPYYSES